MVSVGVDVSKGKSTVCVLKPYGEIVCSPFEIRHEEKDLAALDDLLSKLDGEVRIIMEATGIYHLAILTFFHDRGYFVSVINPFSMKKYANNCKTPLEKRNKRLEVSRKFVEKRTECLTRIISDEGCRLRMNRSIQAEGSFSETKDAMGFRRYRCSGMKNVTAESVLVAMAHNMNKLHAKIQGDRLGQHLHPLKSA